MPPAKPKAAKPQPDKADQPKKSPRQHRPRVDAVIRHIQSGSYDAEIGDLLAAIESRRSARQQAVLDQVKQVYGDDFTVVPQRAQVPGHARPNPFVTPPPTTTGSFDVTTPEEWQDAERRAREQEEALKSEDFGADDVSNSPLIGSIDVSATTSENSQP